jgi:hypothetical protein
MNKSTKEIVSALVRASNDSNTDDSWQAVSMVAEYLDLSNEYIDAMADSDIIDDDHHWCRFCERIVPTVERVCVGCCYPN